MTIIKEGLVSTDLQVNAYFGSKRDIIRAIREATISEQDATNMYEKIVDAITNYTKAYENNADVVAYIPLYKMIANTVQDIANEEKVHIGELQKLLSLLDKEEIQFYKKGAKE